MFVSNQFFTVCKQKIGPNVYVVVQFYPWFKFYFPLFMVTYYDNGFKTMENKI